MLISWESVAFGPAVPVASDEVCAVEDACAGACAFALTAKARAAAPANAITMCFMCTLLSLPV